MRIWPAVAFLAASNLWASAPAFAVTPLKVTSISTLEQLPPPRPPVEESLNADDAVNTALARAEEQHKLAFIVLRANWCQACRILAAFMELPEVRRFIDAHYIVVTVDVGGLDRNLGIPARWGIVDRLSGLPTVVIVNPNDNSLVDRGGIAGLINIDEMTPQQVANWLVWWAK